MQIFLKLTLCVFSFTLCAEDVFSKPWLTYRAGDAVKTLYSVKGSTLHQSSLSYWSSDAEWENKREYPIVFQEDDVLIYDDTKGWFYAITLLPVETKTHKHTHYKLGSSSSLDELKKDISLWKADATDVLFSVPAFRENEAVSLEAMKPINEITRVDLITLLNTRGNYSDILEAFAKEHPGMPPFRMFRFVQNLFQKEALTLGVNPFAAVEGDPFAAFQNDKEIQDLMQAFSQ